MAGISRGTGLALLGLALAWLCRADAGETAWRNPWRADDGSVREGCLVVGSLAGYASLIQTGLGRQREDGEDAPRPETPCPPPSDDGKRLRLARLADTRARLLNGPEALFDCEPYFTGTQRGVRLRQGAVAPVAPRLELAALNRIGLYRRRHDNADAGIEALTVRLGAGPDADRRPWLALTPYAGFGDSDAVGLGLSGGVELRRNGGGELAVAGYAFEPWDEGYETIVHDGRAHGFRAAGTLPVAERLTLSAAVGYEWLELGPQAPGGGEYAGKRGDWTLRGEWRPLERGGASMGHGFRDAGLWREDLISTSLTVFADIYGRRYVRPEGFAALDPVKRSFRQRVGAAYSQAVSPRLGIRAEAYAGQDTGRGVSLGELYGASIRLYAVLSPRLRLHLGWRYDASGDSLLGDGGPERYFFAGVHGNF